MKISMAVSRGVLGALAIVHLTCHQAILTAEPGAKLTVFINPGTIPAHGGIAVVSALVIEELGTPVPDGTVVQFLTSLGRIDEQGKTNDGVARVNLISDSRSGTANVSAFSGAAFGSGTVRIGAVLPATVFLSADPPRILLSVSRTSHIFATVVDASGNPVPNQQVLFRVIPSNGTTPNTTEFIDGESAPFTDNNGRAEAILRTTRLAGSAPSSARVEVVTLSTSGASNTIDVPIQ